MTLIGGRSFTEIETIYAADQKLLCIENVTAVAGRSGNGGVKGTT